MDASLGIFDQNVANYNNNLNNNFYTPFPIMQHLLAQLTTNLENNIQQACTGSITTGTRSPTCSSTSIRR